MNIYLLMIIRNGLFDIIAGTSSGAMNGAILVSHVGKMELGKEA